MLKSLIYLLSISLVISCSPVGRDKRIKILFEKANEKLNTKGFEDAIVIYDEILDMNPDLPEVYHNRGVAYFETGHLVMALADYNHILQGDPENHAVYFNRAKTYLDLGRYERCRDDVNFLKKQFPDSALVYFIEGLLNHQIGQNQAALVSFSKSVSIDRNNAETFANRGMVYFALEDFDKAEEDLKRALKKDPDNPLSINALALVKAEQGKLQIADSLINKALGMLPNQPVFLNNRGYINILLLDFDQAEKDINMSLQLQKDNAWVYQNLGILHYELQHYEEAIINFKKALKIEPKLKKTVMFLLKAYLTQHKVTEACELLASHDGLGNQFPHIKIKCG